MDLQNRVGLADLYRQFHSLRAVSQFLKVSESTIRRRLLEAGVKLNPKGRPRQKLGLQDFEGEQ